MPGNPTLAQAMTTPRFSPGLHVDADRSAMHERLRIVVADDEPDMRDYFVRILPRLGHQVVAVAANGQELVDQCLIHQPDLVITDIRMPEVDGIQAAEQLYRQRPVPVILVSAYHDPELIARAEADHVMAYLIKPIKQADLAPALAIARRRFQQFEQVRQQADDLRQALADRKLIEQAKALLMRRMGLDEAAAFAWLQRLATRQQRKLVDLSRQILATRQALDASGNGSLDLPDDPFDLPDQAD